MTVEQHNSRERLPAYVSSGKPLQQWLKERTFAPEDVLHIIQQVAEALQPLHHDKKVYQRLTPWNVIWSPETQTVSLVGLRQTEKLATEETLLLHTPSTEQSLQYRSPEQTGRLSRSLDHRSDFYALGALAWHLLVGHPLFLGKEPQEILHAHLALRPTPPHRYRDDVPLFLSEILLKLLAKQPEDRYQTTHGLLLDLEQGYQVLQSGEGASFVLGLHDEFLRRLYAERLYGREREQELLHKSMVQAQEGGFEFVLVEGAPGVGKSSLVQSLAESAFRNHGHFAQGRFESGQGELPYLALQTALGELLQRLMAEEQSRLLFWRTRIQQALGDNSSVLLPLLPELGYLLGVTSTAAPLPAVEERLRIQKVFSDLIQALAAPQHPLVLYLDDLQWADSASLELVEFLVTNRGFKGLLLVGGYRNTKADSSKHLDAFLDAVQQRQIPTTSIALENLTVEDIQFFLSELFQTASNDVLDVARIFWEKTAGNPFFLKVLLQRSYRQGLFWKGDSGWLWNEERVQTLTVTDNVVSLLVNSLQRQALSTQQTLQLAACMGRRFHLSNLQALLSIPDEELMERLQPGLDQHLLERCEEGWLRFAHDRVQEAAYALLSEEEKSKTHQMLGQHLMDQRDTEQDPDLLFSIIRHFQHGNPEALPASEKERLVHLALAAGRHARRAGSLEGAFAYLDWGIQLLGPERWTSFYATTLELVSLAVEVGTACRQPERLDAYIDELLQHGRTLTEQLPAWRCRILRLIGEHRMHEALDVTNRFFALSRTPLLNPYNPLRLAWEFVKLYVRLRNKSPEDMKQLPSVQDPLLRGILDLQVQVSPAYHLEKPDLIPTMILRDIRGAVDHGTTAYNIQCWTGWGGILASLLGKVRMGVRFAELSVSEAIRLNRPDLAPHYEMLALYTSKHWTLSYAKMAELCFAASDRGFQAGNLPAAFMSRLVGMGSDFFAGRPLSDMRVQLLDYAQRLDHYQYNLGQPESQLFHHFCSVLQDDFLSTELPLDWDEYSDVEGLFLQWLRHCLQLQFYQLTGQGELAFALVQQSYRSMRLPENAVMQGPYWTYALLAVYDSVEQGRSSRWKSRRFLRLGWKLLRAWCKHLPSSRGYRLDWVNAARLRCEGQAFQAIGLYDKALIQAKAAGFLQDAGLIAEQAASLCGSEGHERMAHDFRREAVQLYKAWGAVAKVNQLLQAEPSLLSPPQGVANLETLQSDERRRSSGENPRSFELNAVLKAAEALSQETDEATLLHRLMKLLMEHAGAERGLLFLYRKTSCKLVAQMEQTDKECLTPNTTMVLDDESQIVSTAMLRYTVLSHQPVVLSNASEEGPFVRDTYIAQARVRSVLCLPILAHDQLMGLIYLENRLTAGVFTQQRQDLLSLIATQAAVSLQWLQNQKSGEVPVPPMINALPQHPTPPGTSRTMDEPLLQAPLLVRNFSSSLNLIGVNVGDWCIVRKVGRGGMSVVYESHNIYTGQRAALKLLDPEHNKQEPRIRRFQREAQILERFNHPNIISLLDVDVDPQFGAFMALEFLQGETLQAVLERHSPVPLGWLLAISEQLCEALEVVHHERILHRDLKPSNIFLCQGEPFPRVCLIDFGIADTSRILKDTRLTQTGMIVGTPAYLAPEQLKEKARLTTAADLYALGVIWFEALTGKHPLGGGTSAELFVKILQDEPASLGQLRPSFQGTELEHLLLQLLAKNPKDRPTDVEVVWSEFAMGSQFLEDPFDTPDRYPTLLEV
ncbi:MAG: GAF domain-containing protein [Deltaproteobacteria bacterium]|nr:MAG: GAF domain-containing protein [Deltaproteobacteria bacterium]